MCIGINHLTVVPENFDPEDDSVDNNEDGGKDDNEDN